LIRTKGTEVIMGAERSLDITSDVPVGATAGKISAAGASLWLGRIESDGKENGGRTEVVRFEIGPGGSSKAAYRSWLGGHYARRRMTLLWRPESGLLPEGRIYQFSGSIDLPGADQNLWITMNTPYSDMDGGWLFRRYQHPGLKSPSTPGACFFGDDIIYMLRRTGNNELGVAFYGSGAAKAPLGDFNDVKHICDYGLSRSIRGLLK
jgi:hypothetical protein